ncbi:hypothetical protein H5410_016366 [Solanum commersonii]|uniref:Uncharacterized protein n=1 Tax=Solanum commersonii TaxID=4109 RepID=A0A9J5ZW75_SOLCO|nr:hypothetical protein H5410_016366 [Solanum commersonii]
MSAFTAAGTDLLHIVLFRSQSNLKHIGSWWRMLNLQGQNCTSVL